MNKQLRRLLDLARRTGDRMIITDPEGEDAFVLMDLAQYERLIDARPAPSAQRQKTESPKDLWDAVPEAGSGAETWDLNKLSASEQHDLEAQYQAYLKEKETQKQPKAVQQVPAETKPSPGLGDDELGEDQFYLEPIE